MEQKKKQVRKVLDKGARVRATVVAMGDCDLHRGDGGAGAHGVLLHSSVQNGWVPKSPSGSQKVQSRK